MMAAGFNRVRKPPENNSTIIPFTCHSVTDISGKYISLSDTALKIYGYRPCELEGTSRWANIHPEDKAPLLENPTSIGSASIRIRKKDGFFIKVLSQWRRIGDIFLIWETPINIFGAKTRKLHIQNAGKSINNMRNPVLTMEFCLQELAEKQLDPDTIVLYIKTIKDMMLEMKMNMRCVLDQLNHHNAVFPKKLKVTEDPTDATFNMEALPARVLNCSKLEKIKKAMGLYSNRAKANANRLNDATLLPSLFTPKITQVKTPNLHDTKQNHGKNCNSHPLNVPGLMPSLFTPKVTQAKRLDLHVTKQNNAKPKNVNPSNGSTLVQNVHIPKISRTEGINLHTTKQNQTKPILSDPVSFRKSHRKRKKLSDVKESVRPNQKLRTKSSKKESIVENPSVEKKILPIHSKHESSGPQIKKLNDNTLNNEIMGPFEESLSFLSTLHDLPTAMMTDDVNLGDDGNLDDIFGIFQEIQDSI